MAEPFLTEPNVPVWKIHFDLIVVVLWTPAVSSSIVKNQLESKTYKIINVESYWGSNQYNHLEIGNASGPDIYCEE